MNIHHPLQKIRAPNKGAFIFLGKAAWESKVRMTDSEMIDLLEELFDMEISAYNYDEKILYSSYSKLNDEERKIKKQAEENRKKYTKFAPLYGLCEKYYNLKNE